MIANAVTPLILFLFNSIFIPTLVDFISYYEESETKSARHKNNLFKQYFFMLINTVFLPITGITTISNFLLYLTKKDMGEF
jgi:hypothetical protein